jgi:hypothetical protein
VRVDEALELVDLVSLDAPGDDLAAGDGRRARGLLGRRLVLALIDEFEVAVRIVPNDAVRELKGVLIQDEAPYS